MKQLLLTQHERIKNLFDLIQENPMLELFPIVNNDCVPDDNWCYWAACFGKAEINEYFFDDDRMFLKNEDYDELVERYVDNNYEKHPDLSDEELNRLAEKAVEKYEWIKVIVVYIEPF